MTTGRRPKPTALKELAGNPGKRPLNRREPKPRVKIPKPPEWLAGDGLKEYRRVARLLVGMRVLTEADGMALALYCQQYQVFLDANAKIAAVGEYNEIGGMVLKGGNGGYYQNPYVGIANSALKSMRTFLVEFGLTPASRSKIQAMPEEEKDLATALFEHVAVGD